MFLLSKEIDSTFVLGILTFPAAIPPKIRTTPSHCDKLTFSAKTSDDKITATGSSEAVNIVPSPGPICFIPIENKSGGKATPNNPRNNPYGATPIKTGKWIKSVGVKNKKTVINPPVESSALF